MKTIKLLGLTCFTFLLIMTSQSCIKGFEFGDNNNDQNTNPPNDCTTGIILSSQKEIDKFSKDHSDCTQIFGNLIIGRDDVGSFITNLNGLRQVTKINGDLISFSLFYYAV